MKVTVNTNYSTSFTSNIISRNKSFSVKYNDELDELRNNGNNDIVIINTSSKNCAKMQVLERREDFVYRTKKPVLMDNLNFNEAYKLAKSDMYKFNKEFSNMLLGLFK